MHPAPVFIRLLTAACAVAAGCGPSVEPSSPDSGLDLPADAGFDGGRSDGGLRDGGARGDAGWDDAGTTTDAGADVDRPNGTVRPSDAGLASSGGPMAGNFRLLERAKKLQPNGGALTGALREGLQR